MFQHPKEDTTTLELSLHNLNNVDEIQARAISLTDKPITIGRASKKDSRDASASASNGWINSPVISRNHAEFSLGPNNTLVVKDLESMHGTYINDVKMNPNTNYPVESGDIVQFGDSVISKADTFIAPRYRATYGHMLEEENEYRSSFGYSYRAPHYESDISVSGSGSDNSEGELEEDDNQTQSIAGTSSDNPITLGDGYTFAPGITQTLAQSGTIHDSIVTEDEDENSDDDVLSEVEERVSPRYTASSLLYSTTPAYERSPLYAPGSLAAGFDEEESNTTDEKDTGADADASPELGAIDSNDVASRPNAGHGIFEFIEQTRTEPVSSVNLPSIRNSFMVSEEAVWAETDPFASTMPEDGLSQPSTMPLTMSYPDFKHTPLPAVKPVNVETSSTAQKSQRINIMDLVTQSPASTGKKRKAEEISENTPNATDFTVAIEPEQEAQGGAREPVTEVAQTATVVRVIKTETPERPAQRRRLLRDAAMVAAGTVIGAFGLFTSLVSLPDDYFVTA